MIGKNKTGGGSGLMPFRQPKKTATAAQAGITSLLAGTARFEGNLILQEGIKIDGQFIGTIFIPEDHENLFAISEKGHVEGTVHVGRAVIAGRMVGTLTAVNVTLTPTARIDGEIYYDNLRVEDGATINGTIIRRSDGHAIGSGEPAAAQAQNHQKNVVQLTSTANP